MLSRHTELHPRGGQRTSASALEYMLIVAIVGVVVVLATGLVCQELSGVLHSINAALAAPAGAGLYPP